MVWLRHKLADLSSRGSGGSGGAGGAGSCPKRINMNKQGKHMPGHKNYQAGKSTLNVSPDWIEKFIGTGTPVNGYSPGTAGYRELVDFGQTIGNFCTKLDPIGRPTTNGIFHYALDGVHLVPSAPNP